jgi:ABC-type transport system involved in multi-copper enzyme maturation permease subunit
MNFLPVAVRELRLIAARRRTYSLRILSATVVLLISLGMLYAGFGGAMSASSAGRNLFLLLSCLAAAYVLLDGALATADCLSQEKREGTLGLLFLSSLSGYDIVAGKLVSRVANSAYCLLAALPALGVAIFLGGITAGQYCEMALALLNGLFFAASFGMFASALCYRERAALMVTVAGVLLWTALLPLLGWGLSGSAAGATIHPGFLIGSPLGAFLLALWTSGTGPSSSLSFGLALGMVHLLGWSFLVGASLLLLPGWQHEPVTMGWRRPLSVRGASPGKQSETVFRRYNSLEANPLIWSKAGQSPRGLGLWPILILSTVVWLVGWALFRSRWPVLPVYFGLALAFDLSLMFLVTLQACRAPGEDLRSGVLELLLTTPRGDDFYVPGRLLLLKRQALWPTLYVLAIDLGLMIAGCIELGTLNGECVAWVAAFLLLFALLMADLYTLSWVGFWQGLKTRSTVRALRTTIGYVWLSRGLLLLAVVSMLGLLTQGQLYQSGLGAAVCGIGYLVSTGMTVLHFGGAARSALQDDLRQLALGS